VNRTGDCHPYRFARRWLASVREAPRFGSQPQFDDELLTPSAFDGEDA
jgi:hypothetical protein